MMKKNKKNTLEAGDKPPVSKCKIQQSAPLASAIPTVEKAKKPKAVPEDDRYIRYLRKLGVDMSVKVEGDAEED